MQNIRQKEHNYTLPWRGRNKKKRRRRQRNFQPMCMARSGMHFNEFNLETALTETSEPDERSSLPRGQ